MTNETSTKLKNIGWGTAIGAVVAVVIGFSLGGWVTATTAKAQSDEVLLASRSAICVAQFTKAPDHEAQLKIFRATDSWNRRELVEKGGWDKMPGQEQAKSYVAGACADGISALLDK